MLLEKIGFEDGYYVLLILIRQRSYEKFDALAILVYIEWTMDTVLLLIVTLYAKS